MESPSPHTHLRRHINHAHQSLRSLQKTALDFTPTFVVEGKSSLNLRLYSTLPKLHVQQGVYYTTTPIHITGS